MSLRLWIGIMAFTGIIAIQVFASVTQFNLYPHTSLTVSTESLERKMPEILPTVTLNPLTRADLKDFMFWAGDPIVTQSLTWDAYENEATAMAFLESIAEKHPWFMAIRHGGRAVGAITLSPGIGRTACRAELGYVIARPGMGFGSAAARIALQRGFQDLGVRRIEAFVDPEHDASIRVLENSGFVREAILRNYVIHRGQIRDRYVYAFIRP